MRASTQASSSSTAYASHGSLQVARAFPCHHHQAIDKSLPRPFPAVLRPFAGALLRQSLCGPLESLGLYSFRRGSCIVRWLGSGRCKGCQCFEHMLRIWSSVSLRVLLMLCWFGRGLKNFTSCRVAKSRAEYGFTNTNAFRLKCISRRYAVLEMGNPYTR